MLSDMVTMGARAPSTPRVSLAALLERRDASIAIERPSAFSRGIAAIRGKAVSARTTLIALVLVLAGLTSRHGLVLAGLAAFTFAAAQHSTTAALITGGIGAFFLELRRK